MSTDAGNELSFAGKRVGFGIVKAVHAIVNPFATTKEGANNIEFVRESAGRSRFRLMVETAFANTFANVKRHAVRSIKHINVSAFTAAKHGANCSHFSKQLADCLPLAPPQTRNTFIT